MKAICVYVDGGKGHYIPAKAVAEQLEKQGVSTSVEEFFDYLDIRWMGRINKRYWRYMLRHPDFEQKTSKKNDSASNGMDVAVKFAKKHLTRTLEANMEEAPFDFIFATHPYASTILSEMLSAIGSAIPVYYFATDVFSAPVATICDKLRRFYVSTAEGAEVVRSLGQTEDSIVISPFPLQSSIAESERLSKADARVKLGLEPDLFTLQLNLGGEGIGSITLLEDICKADLPMQIVVLGGLTDKQKKRIASHSSRCSNVKLHVPGFISNVSDYLYASDIIAGRAGINTIVEAMSVHRPFLITELVYTVLPSAKYVEKYGVGWNCADNRKKQFEIVKEYCTHPEKLDALDSAFNNIPIEYSAPKLASMIISDVSLLKK